MPQDDDRPGNGPGREPGDEGKRRTGTGHGDTVAEQLEKARTNLLDMSLRNKLLNFRELSRSTATVVDEVPGAVYERLVLDEDDMSFLPREDHPDHRDLEPVEEDDAVRVREDGIRRCLLCDEPAGFRGRSGILEHLETEHEVTLEEAEDEGTEAGGDRDLEEMERLWELPEVGGPSGSAADRHTDEHLQTPHPAKDLQKRLYHIHNRAEALVEDAGYNALHLAVGVLEWTETAVPDGRDDRDDAGGAAGDQADDPNRAPLILVPVELDRESARSGFQVRWNGDEVAGNRTLDLRLAEEGVDLPDLEAPREPEGIRDHLEAVEAAVEEVDGWRVRPEIHLGFFDFTKFVMYQDLDPEGWEEGGSPADHPLVRALLDPEGSADQPPPFDEADVDEELAPTDVHHVVDADPSQVAAIEDVKRGRDLVVEGPPGTGKSQTIVNMVAELLADGKTVLFVSEKLAALDVVKDRLDRVNVGDFCLELHSEKASKSAFLEELERLSTLGDYEADVPRRVFRELVRRREELDAYAEALSSPYGRLARSPWDLYETKEEALHQVEAGSLPRLDLEEPAEITPAEAREARSALEELAARYQVVRPAAEHPWRGTHPGQVLPRDRREVEDDVEAALDALADLGASLGELEEAAAVTEPRSLDEVGEALDAAELLRESEPVDAAVLRGSTWNRAPRDAEDLVGRVRRLRELEADVGERTEPEHVEPTLPELLTRYRSLGSTWTRWFRPAWYRVRRQVESLYGGDPPDEADQVIRDLEELIELDELRDEVEGDEDRGRDLFGSLWRGAGSDPGELERFAEWAVDFRRALLDEVLREESVDLVTRGVGERSMDGRIRAVEEDLAAVRDRLAALDDRLGIEDEPVFGAPREEVHRADLREVLEDLASAADGLERWARYDEAREAARATVAAPLVPIVDRDRLPPGDVEPTFEGGLADELLHEAFRARDALAGFDARLHEDRVEEFRELDRRSIELHRKRVIEALVERTPRLLEGASDSSQAGVLQHEFEKERRHMPIRVLLREAGELVQQMKPCFMMSPLSVAKYLEPGELTFDVVVFDEASQVRPEDALGAVVRGDQVVVLGDSKQLPPTSFFEHVVEHQEDDEDPWAYNVADVESILGLCRQTFPVKRLRWHYRSRHESLVAVSNQEFYDNDLVIYPSPVQDADDLGLSLRHLPETTYDRGGSGVNREEARAVAEAAAEHVREHPSRSLGVGTFSRAQQEAVLEEVELLRKADPEVDEAFSRDRDEPFFVKNLERIQGDERDVVFVSVGYGYDHEGEFSHNFGPLNHDGGWRRLNVLITRARERCEVFSNFTADALDLSKTDARGVEALEVFLDYAGNRNLASTTDVGGDPDSPFQRSVLRFLRDEGYDVDAQVGSAGFRVDLAVQHPEDPGRYVLGIECDGASYHSTPVARARDRLREEVLEDRGWRLHRVWSTGWYRDRPRARERLVAAVGEALGDAPAGGSAGTGPGGGEARGGGTDRDGTGPAGAEPASPGEAPGGAGEAPSLEALRDEAAGSSLEDLAEPYEPARGLPYARLGDHDVQSTRRAVVAVVEAEGPVHVDRLADRVRDSSDVERLGKRVRGTIDEAVEWACKHEGVRRDGSFLLPEGMREIPVRTREDVEADIEWIHPGEIEAAIRRILDHQYATPRDALVRQTAALLGFARTGSRIRETLEERVDALVEEGVLAETRRGLDLA